MIENNRHPFACTTLAITDKKNVFIMVGQWSFSSDEPTSILAYYPQGHTFQQNAPDGTPGLRNYSVKYPFYGYYRSY